MENVWSKVVSQLIEGTVLQKKKRLLKDQKCQTWGENRQFPSRSYISLFLPNQNQRNVGFFSMIEFGIKYIGKYMDTKLNLGCNLK